MTATCRRPNALVTVSYPMITICRGPNALVTVSYPIITMCNPFVTVSSLMMLYDV